MNYIVVFAHVALLFYILYVFYETTLEHNHLDVTYITRYAFLALLCCLLLFVLPYAWFIYFFILVIVTAPILIYTRIQQKLKYYLQWIMVAGGAFIAILFFHYIYRILPNLSGHLDYQIDIFYMDMLAFLLLIYFQGFKKTIHSSYAVVATLGILLVFLQDIVVYPASASAMTDVSLLLPIILTACFLFLFRNSYAMEKSNAQVLQLTVRRYTEKENKDKYETIENQNKMLMQQMHDMKKHLQVLQAMQDNQQDFKLYQDEIVQKAEELLFMKQTGNTMIDKILQTYRPRLLKAQIQCNMEVDSIDFTFMNIIDASAMLANLLDNAIESCVKCEERFLLLKIKEQKQMIILKMKNSCKEINEENGELHTTKSNAIYHGYGMRNIAMIAHKYHGNVSYHFDAEHHVFTTTISLFPDRS